MPSSSYAPVALADADDPDNNLGGNTVSASDSAVDDNDADNDDASQTIMTIDEAIESLGMGPFQLWVLAASGLCFAADAMQVLLLTFLSLTVQSEWLLSNEETASLTSSLFCGAGVGTMVLGPLADVWGRRPVFLLAASLISVFGFLTAACPNYWVLVTVLFGVGVGVGGLTVPFDLLAEFLPSKGRGTNLLLIEYFWTAGCLYVVACAAVTLHGTVPHWRTLCVLTALPCVLSAAIGYCCVPESARWLVAQDRREDALAVLQRGARLNGKPQLFVNVVLAAAPEEKEGSLADLFTPTWRFITLRLWGTWAAFAFGYYGTIMATTKVFAAGLQDDNEVPSDDTTPHPTDEPSFDYPAIFLSSAAELVGTTLVIVAVDRVGRIPSQVLSYCLAGLSVFMLCMTAQSFPHARSLLMGLGFSARVWEMAGSCVSWVSTAEILTTEVRGTGHATANAMARLGAFVAPWVVQGKASFRQIGVTMLVVHCFTVFCVARLPETKGRSMGGGGSGGGNNEHGDSTESSEYSRHLSMVGVEDEQEQQETASIMVETQES